MIEFYNNDRYGLVTVSLLQSWRSRSSNEAVISLYFQFDAINHQSDFNTSQDNFASLSCLSTVTLTIMLNVV